MIPLASRGQGSPSTKKESVFWSFLCRLRRRRKHTKSVTANIVGKGTTEVKVASRLSHVLFGYERWCLETVCKDFEHTQCLIYDGWISPSRDVKKLKKSIVDRSMVEFGFPMELEIKMVRIPDSVRDVMAKQ